MENELEDILDLAKETAKEIRASSHYQPHEDLFAIYFDLLTDFSYLGPEQVEYLMRHEKREKPTFSLAQWLSQNSDTVAESKRKPHEKKKSKAQRSSARAAAKSVYLSLPGTSYCLSGIV